MIAGVDGCRAGWVVGLADVWPCQAPPRLVLCRDFGEVLAATAACLVTAVDMPIGLPSGAEHRQCDEIGRRMLGSRGAARLFFAPPRPSLGARTPADFQKIHRSIAGKGAGLPVWGIAAKLFEVDAAMTPALQDRVYEAHPELAWRHLAGSVLASKHTREGLAQRQRILRRYIADLDELAAARDGLRPSGASLDDLFDALVMLSAAQAIAGGPDLARRIPTGEPEYDERGLRMEIWF